MTLKTPKFKQLQATWYDKLKDDGFEDIENTNDSQRLLKTWHSTYFRDSKYVKSHSEKEEYYYQAEQFLSEYKGLPLFFRTQVNEEAWTLHCQGVSLRKIAAHFKAKGIKTNKDEINKVILWFKSIMGVG